MWSINNNKCNIKIDINFDLLLNINNNVTRGASNGILQKTYITQ